MRNEKWEMKNGRRLFRRSMPHIPLRYMWGFQQFTLLRSVSAYCGSHGWCSVGWLIWPIRGRIRACGATFYKTTRCVSSGTLTIFIDVSGLKPGVPHKCRPLRGRHSFTVSPYYAPLRGLYSVVFFLARIERAAGNEVGALCRGVSRLRAIFSRPARCGSHG